MRAIRIAAAAVLALVLTACSVYTVLYGGQLHKRKTDIMSEKEVSQAVNANNCKLIELVTDTVKVSGGGAAVSGSTVTIRKPGTYRISGTLEDGQILVDVDEGAVALLLDGASVSCSSGPALHVLDSRKLVLYLTEGTSNFLTSGEETQITAYSSDLYASGGALMFGDSAVIAGEGSLTVLGYVNNGIHCSNDLVIRDGNIRVEAVNTGIKGKDSLTVSGGRISVLSGGDGLGSDGTDDGTGTVTVIDGTLDIVSYDDGIQAESLIDLKGGEISIESRDDGLNSSGDITVDGASITADCRDDAVHADCGVLIASGKINVTSSNEGIEGRNITVDGGTVSIVSFDDGFNCVSDSSKQMWGPYPQEISDDLPVLLINGGSIYINAQGDGLDSNGNIVIGGGTLVIDGPSQNWNGSLDSGRERGGVITVNGGTLLAVGSTGMVELPDSGSSQCTVSYAAAFKAGSVISITDSSGTVLAEHVCARSGGNIIFSSGDLELNGAYVLHLDGSDYDIVMTDTVTAYGRTGMQGGPGPGGKRPS